MFYNCGACPVEVGGQILPCRIIIKVIHKCLVLQCCGNSPEGSAHSLIVHVRLVLVFPPQSGYSFGVNQLENALVPLHPLDVPGTGVFVLQQLQQKLPQVGCVACKTKAGSPTMFGFEYSDFLNVLSFLSSNISVYS